MSDQQGSTEELTIGSYLREQREKKKLSIKMVAQHTKISTTKLELLESNDFQNLPSLAYVTGFVKSYAKTLGLDQNECLALLEKAYGVKKEPIPDEQLEKLSDSDKPSIETLHGLPLGKIVAGLAVITALIGVLVFVGQDRVEPPAPEPITPKSVDSDTPLAESRESQEEVAAQETELEEMAEEEDLATGPSEQEENTTIADQQDQNENEDEEETKDEDAVEVEKEVNLRPFPGPTYELASTLSQEDLEVAIPESYRSSQVEEGQHNVYIKASQGETWLTYKTDEGDIRRFVLKEGRDIFLRGQVHRLFLGNVNATEIFINNQPIQVYSRTGVKSLVIPNDVVGDYKLPLFIYPENGGVITSEQYEENLAN